MKVMFLGNYGYSAQIELTQIPSVGDKVNVFGSDRDEVTSISWRFTKSNGALELDLIVIEVR